VQTDKYGAQRTCVLEAGASETLRVAPVPKRIRSVAPGKGTWSERWGTAINLHFEGNWMPLLVRRCSVPVFDNPIAKIPLAQRSNR
jgi:hypothetical protein